MEFARELESVLPDNIPHRERLVLIATRHLELIVETNRQFNLTRITDPRDAAIKHVLDSVLPWRHFASARRIVDAGTGAGFPGIPLAAVLPEVQWTLADSTGKKIRFVESAVAALGLANVEVVNARVEALLAGRAFDVITARAVAPLARALEYFGPSVAAGARALLYKGPDVEAEIEEAAPAARKRRIGVRVLEQYDLPDSLGARTLVELARLSPPARG